MYILDFVFLQKPKQIDRKEFLAPLDLFDFVIYHIQLCFYASQKSNVDIYFIDYKLYTFKMFLNDAAAYWNM